MSNNQAPVRDVNLVRNTLLSFASNGSNLLLLGLLLLAGRMLPIAEFGLVTFAMALGATLALLSDFGTTELVKRSVARQPETGADYLHNVTTFKFFGAGVGLIIATIVVLFSDNTRGALLVILLIVAGSIMKSFKLLVVGLMQANERFDLSASVQLIHNVGLLTVCSTVLMCGGGLTGFALSYFLFKLGDAVLAFVLTHRTLYRFQFGWNFASQVSIQKAAIPFGAFIIVQEVYWYADTLMLTYLANMEAVGIYNAAFRLLEGLIVFPNLICQAILPHLSRLFHTAPVEHGQLSVIVQKFCVCLAILISGMCFLAAPFLIVIVYGDMYAQSADLFKILSLGFFFVFTNIYFLNLLISVDQQKLLWRLSCGGLLFNVIANAVAIPVWGATGAAICTLLSEVLVLGLGLALLSRRLPVRNLVVPLFKALGLGVVTLLCCQLVFSNTYVVLSVLLYGVVLIFAMYLTGLLKPKDMRDFANTK